MAIAFTGNSTSFEDSSIVDTGSGPISFTVNVGDCVEVVVTRFAAFAIGAVTDNGSGGGNTYTQQVLYNANLPNIAIFTTIATKSATTISVAWTAGARSTVAITSHSGVGSIGVNNGSNHGTTTTTETITCTLGNSSNWAVAGLAHSFAGGAPTQQNGTKRVTSAGSTANDYTSINDNTGSTSVVCSNTYTFNTVFSAVFVELVPSVSSGNTNQLTMVGCGT